MMHLVIGQSVCMRALVLSPLVMLMTNINVPHIITSRHINTAQIAHITSMQSTRSHQQSKYESTVHNSYLTLSLSVVGIQPIVIVIIISFRFVASFKSLMHAISIRQAQQISKEMLLMRLLWPFRSSNGLTSGEMIVK